MDKISDKRERLPEQQSIENDARTGTHDHVRPEPLHSVPLWSLTTACVSSPDEMGHLFQGRARAVFVSRCNQKKSKKNQRKEKKKEKETSKGYLPTRLIKLSCLKKKVTRNRAIIEATKKIRI